MVMKIKLFQPPNPKATNFRPGISIDSGSGDHPAIPSASLLEYRLVKLPNPLDWLTLRSVAPFPAGGLLYVVHRWLGAVDPNLLNIRRGFEQVAISQNNAGALARRNGPQCIFQAENPGRLQRDTAIRCLPIQPV